MLNLCVSHIPGTVDACPINGQMHLRFRVQKGMIVSSKLIYNCDKNMWHKFRDEAEMKITHTDSELEYYSVTIPLTDTRFSYIFELTCTDGKIRYLSEEGLTDSYDHTLGYFSFFQYTFIEFQPGKFPVHIYAAHSVFSPFSVYFLLFSFPKYSFQYS